MNASTDNIELPKSSLHFTSLDIALLAVAIYFLSQLISAKRYSVSLPVPPGPRPLPFLGNLLDLPKGPEGPHWAKHKALYGETNSILFISISPLR